MMDMVGTLINIDAGLASGPHTIAAGRFSVASDLASSAESARPEVLPLAQGNTSRPSQPTLLAVCAARRGLVARPWLPLVTSSCGPVSYGQEEVAV
jgi:hypothetical protein